MDQTPQTTEAREDRLILFYKRQLAAIEKKEIADPKVEEACGLVHDTRLARTAVEFRLSEKFIPGRWVAAKGLGVAFETYVNRLREMELVRHGNSGIDLTQELKVALENVVEAADILAALGWPVNWEQSVQAVLEETEFGLRNGTLVDRYMDPPDVVTLGEELLLLGTLTFYRQHCGKDGRVGVFKPTVLSALTKAIHENTILHIVTDADKLPGRFRYSSEWISDAKGGHFRIVI